MRKQFVFLLVLLTPILSKAQVQPYLHMDLDTSCFWIQEYNYRFLQGSKAIPSFHVQGEVIQYVEKDTLINSKKYYKIKGYSTTTQIFDPFWTRESYQRSLYNCYSPTLFIREDTMTNQIISLDSNGKETPLLDFSKNLGDSIYYVPGTSFAGWPIDSIVYKDYYGSVRKTSYNYPGQIPPAPMGLYFTIEGIGANYNFPQANVGHYNTPVFRLSSFIKNGQVKYKRNDYPITDCYRKEPANPNCELITPWSTPKVVYESRVYQNTLEITNLSNEKLDLVIYNLQGQAIYKTVVGTYLYRVQYQIHNLNTGIYILSISSPDFNEQRKIFLP